MNYEKVVVKQIPDELAMLTGLHKYNRSKMPKTGDFFHAAVLNGRAITGIDEDALDIMRLPDSERVVKQEEVKNLRTYLEKYTQKDLSATSSFWEVFGVAISSDSDLTLNKDNPLDVIRYHMLVSNGYVAPSKEAASLPEFRNAKYYCHVESVVNDEEVSTQMIRDKARSELLKLSDNTDKMVLIGQYLEGDKYKPNMKPMTLYKMMSEYINSTQEPGNLQKFLKAIKTPVEDLNFRIIVDRAMKKKVIKYRDGYYQRGQVTLGKTPLDVYENLKKPEFATELFSLREELE